MKNLQQLVERYANKSNGLGHIQWGGKDYYEINSNICLSLNSCYAGFILNDKGQVELYDLNKREVTERVYYSDEDWENKVDYETQYFYDRMESIKWWGKTLDNYYPWPWYPEKEIIAFEVMRDFPLFSCGDILKVDEEGLVRSVQDWEMAYWVSQCLEYPEFFKPIYK